MTERAKLFRTGGSQALRLPKKYRFDGQTQVRIRRDGSRIVLEPTKRTWSKRFLGLAGSAPDFPCPVDAPRLDGAPDFD